HGELPAAGDSLGFDEPSRHGARDLRLTREQSAGAACAACRSTRPYATAAADGATSAAVHRGGRVPSHLLTGNARVHLRDLGQESFWLRAAYSRHGVVFARTDRGADAGAHRSGARSTVG